MVKQKENIKCSFLTILLLIGRETSEPAACSPTFTEETEYQKFPEHRVCNGTDCEYEKLPACGKNGYSVKSSRIIGGTDAKYGSLPYQVFHDLFISGFLMFAHSENMHKQCPLCLFFKSSNHLSVFSGYKIKETRPGD